MSDGDEPAHPVQSDSQSSTRPRSRRAYANPRSIIFFVTITGILLAADLGIKAWAFAHVAGTPVVLTRLNAADPMTIPRHEPLTLIPYLLELRLVTNTGAVFGLGKGAQPLFIVASILALILIGWIFAISKARAWLAHVALAAILAGALGNLYDRVMFNAVRDMFHMLPHTQLWPWVFNLADVLLNVGVVSTLILIWRSDMSSQTPSKAGS